MSEKTKYPYDDNRAVGGSLEFGDNHGGGQGGCPQNGQETGADGVLQGCKAGGSQQAPEGDTERYLHGYGRCSVFKSHEEEEEALKLLSERQELCLRALYSSICKAEYQVSAALAACKTAKRKLQEEARWL